MWLNWERIRLQCRRPGFNPWVGKIPWRRARQTIPVFLPGEAPWTEEPGRLHSMWSQRVGHDWATKHSTLPQFHALHRLSKGHSKFLHRALLVRIQANTSPVLCAHHHPHTHTHTQRRASPSTCRRWQCSYLPSSASFQPSGKQICTQSLAFSIFLLWI